MTTTTTKWLSLLLLFIVSSFLPHRCRGWFVLHHVKNLPISNKPSPLFVTTTTSPFRRIIRTKQKPIGTKCSNNLLLYARRRRQQNDNNSYENQHLHQADDDNLRATRNNNHNDDDDDDDDFLQSILKEHGFDRRVISLSPERLPILAEFQQDGQAQLCWIHDIIESPDVSKKKPPRLNLRLPDGSSQIVDLGQITTIWTDEDDHQQEFYSECDDKQSLMLLEQIIDIESIKETSWPVGHIESTLDHLWQRMSQGPSSSIRGGLSKKQVSKLVETCPDESIKSNVDQVLRQVVKAGKFYERLVDSEDVRWACFQSQPNQSKRVITMMQRRAYSAKILGDDAAFGGRFKRFGCIPLPSSSSYSSGKIALINGGWLALDQSVRATSEARKFSERVADNGRRSSYNNVTTTIADERIIHRLECLAMEETSSSSFSGRGISSIEDGDEKSLELDVRQTLKTMDLPTTSEGAKLALIRIGKWTESSSSSNSDSGRQTVQAWPQSVLAAAEWYSKMDKQRRRRLHNAAVADRENELEGRVDLTKLPSVCVDAARAKFRDDAMSVRPRASTGRKANPEASKWEILLHISDVSDIHATNTQVDDPDRHLELLRKAAAGRGVSRYNLPSGPLHLLPPVALQSLALQTINPDLTSKSNIIQSNRHRNSVNRCVTLWVYIDERNGKILDAGIERTIISCPLALSFESATRLLEESPEKEMDPVLKKARAVFGIVERNVGLWKQHHTARNEASQAREKRLEAREVVGRATYGKRSSRDDGREGFVRTRGHQTVDACLELYGYAIQGFLQKKKASLPRVAGTGPDRLGRVATAPLRRFIDGVAQQQALAVICGYGGDSLTKQQCIEIGKETTKVVNAVNNLDSRKPGTKKRGLSHHQKNAIRTLKNHLSTGGKTLVPAMGTGRQNEVVILGVGTVASCTGVRGTLKPGEKVMVRLTKVDEDRGVVSATLALSQDH